MAGPIWSEPYTDPEFSAKCIKHLEEGGKEKYASYERYVV